MVDDGSTDGTAEAAASFAEKDSRIRVVSQRNAGEGAARNAGISIAHFDWLLFLDADDWIAPAYLQRMREAVAAYPEFGAVHCGWINVDPTGRVFGEHRCMDTGDMFSIFANRNVFPIHACIVRRALVEEVGCFDPSLRTCADWDLWQRIARVGARFGGIPDFLAWYRLRLYATWTSSSQFFIDGLRVVTQGHSPDRRVTAPHPLHARGLAPERLASDRLYFACFCAGLELARGGDAPALLKELVNDRDPGLDPNRVSAELFHSALLPGCHSPGEWGGLWPRLQKGIGEFLLALEAQSLAQGLAHRTRTMLERSILQFIKTPRPLNIGGTLGVEIELSEPMADIHAALEIERVLGDVKIEGEYLGTLELPVLDGLLSDHVLADAIAAEFAWPIIGRFFGRTIYPKVRREMGEAGVSLWREKLRLAESVCAEDILDQVKLHNRIGWTIFLQEIWGRAEWDQGCFYHSEDNERAVGWCKVVGYTHTVEVAEELPNMVIYDESIDVEFTVGGVSVGFINIKGNNKRIRAQQLRATLTKEMGFELCCAVVREGLIGTPLTGPLTLRERLAQAAERNKKINEHPAVFPLVSENLAPNWARAVRRAFSTDEGGWVLGRHAGNASMPGISRRAFLPSACAPDLLDAAEAAGQPIIRVVGQGPQRIAYAPDLLWRSCRQPSIRVPRYKQRKYEQVLSLLPPVPIRRALELFCGEGFFTELLASRAEHLLATDISQVAIERAAERCREHKNVQFARHDFMEGPPPGQFDLIVCNEEFYYFSEPDALKAFARKMINTLEPGGYLLTAHTDVEVDNPTGADLDRKFRFDGNRIGEILAQTPSLRLVRELRTPLYRIQLFRRRKSIWSYFAKPSDRCMPLIGEASILPSAPHVPSFLTSVGKPTPREVAPILTYQLPILMYHQVAPDGPSYLSRYRVSPEVFEEQLRYLHDEEFHTVSLEEWWGAMRAQKPIPGRAVLFTFDDGFLDFWDYAWPLLKRYGFSAIVFLVAEKIGLSNDWDKVYGEEVALLGWKDIHQLQDEGVEFGSHSATHSYLTGLSPAEVVREGSRSRAILERGLRRSVTAFAYPHGAEDQVIQHLIGACGYKFSLSCRPGPSKFQDPLLALPRLEVTGSDRLPDFIAKLNAS